MSFLNIFRAHMRTTHHLPSFFATEQKVSRVTSPFFFTFSIPPSEELERAAREDLGAANRAKPRGQRVSTQEGRGQAYEAVVCLLKETRVLSMVKPLNSHLGDDSSSAQHLRKTVE